MRHELVNIDAAAQFVAGLVRAGVRHVCVCPGGRSAPLAVACAAHSELRSWVVADERSAAFFALGIARERAEAVALVCTSGTAAANFLPGVVEAAHSAVPLVVVTADRPPELRDVGAAQTIDQVRLFGTHTRWSVDLPPPTDDIDLAPTFAGTAARAVALATGAPAGPVHVNMPFRDPLVPAGALPRIDYADARFARGTAHVGATPTLTAADVERLVAHVRDEPARGLIVCGPRADVDDADALARLATDLGWPVLADPLSGLRFRLDPGCQADAYDLLLRNPETRAQLAPTTVLHLGGLPVSKPLQKFLSETRPRAHVVVTSPGTWPDATATATFMVHAAADDVVRELGRRLGGARDPGWTATWMAASARARAASDAELAADGSLFEGKVVCELARGLGPDALLHVGNSMPVRDLDTFGSAAEDGPRVACNRGANGIDGVVSAALGAAAVSPDPVTLVVGDLSFLHDVGALHTAARHEITMTIVVIDNDGGGIFSFLPESGYGETFDAFFATPHGQQLGPIIEAGGARAVRVESWAEFDAAVADRTQRGLTVIEVPSDREANVRTHAAHVDAAALAWSDMLRASA